MFGHISQLVVRYRVYLANKWLPAWLTHKQSVADPGEGNAPLISGPGWPVALPNSPPPPLPVIWRSGYATGNYLLAYSTGRQKEGDGKTFVRDKRDRAITILACFVVMFTTLQCSRVLPKYLFERGWNLTKNFFERNYSHVIHTIFKGKPEISVGKSNSLKWALICDDNYCSARKSSFSKDCWLNLQYRVNDVFSRKLCGCLYSRLLFIYSFIHLFILNEKTFFWLIAFTKSFSSHVKCVAGWSIPRENLGRKQTN